MQRFFSSIVRHRRGVVAAAAVSIAAASPLASRVAVDYSVEQFFPTWGKDRAVFDEYRRAFVREDAQVAFFLATPDGLDRASWTELSRVAAIFRREGLDGVRWAGSVPRLSLAAHAGSRSLRAEARRASSDRLYVGSLWNANGTVYVVQGFLSPGRNNDAARRETEARLTSAIQGLGIRSRWALSGTPVIRARVPRLLEVDQTLLLGGGILLFFVILFLFFRHAGRVLMALGAVLPAYLLTLAVMAALDRPVTVLTSFMPIVILVVGVCDTTHVLSHWERLRSEGWRRDRATVHTFAGLAGSCFFTSLTTAIGFASLSATGIGVVSDFGVFTAVAIMVTYAFSMTLLPALLSFGGASPHPRTRPTRMFGLAGLLRWARVAAQRRPAWMVPGFAGVTLIAVVLASRLHIDSYLVDDLREDTSIIQDLRWIEGAGFGLFQTDLFIRSEDGSRLVDPDMLAWMRRFQRFISTEPLVVATLGPPDLVDALPARAPSPEATYQAVRSAVPDLVGGMWRPEDGVAQVIVTVRDRGSRATLPFLHRVDDYLRRNPPPAGRADLTGTVRMADTFSHHVLGSFGPSIALALVLIWGVMSFLFRSVRLGLLAMVPNLFPLLVLAGVMALLGVPLKPSTIMVFSIAFGIAVDDSIHLMGRFTYHGARGLPRGRALRRALRETGPALVLSTVVVGAGFSLLLLSRFEVLFLVGLLTITTSAAALLADLFLFPALLLGVGPRTATAPES